MKRELVVTAADREYAVIVDDGGRADGNFDVTIDGATHRVAGRRLRAGTWSLVIGGASFVVDLDARRDGVAASTGASEAVLRVEDARARRLAEATGTRSAARGETIRAPIAGKVVKVLAAVGDSVAAGSAVIVLEAMKMENELVTERGGLISALHKQAGQAVDSGEPLVELV